MLAAAKYIGAGLACSGLIGAGAGIGLIFSSLIASTARNPQIRDAIVYDVRFLHFISIALVR